MSFNINSKIQFDLYFERYQEINRMAFVELSNDHRSYPAFRITDAYIFNKIVAKDEREIFTAFLYAINLISQVADFYIASGRLLFRNDKVKHETFPQILGVLADAHRHVCPSVMPLFILKSIDPTRDYWGGEMSSNAWRSNQIQFDACIEWCCIRMDALLEILSNEKIYRENKNEFVNLFREEHKRISENNITVGFNIS